MYGLVGILVVVGFLVFYFGAQYGRRAEQYVVVEVLAKYRHVGAEAATAVSHILSTLTVGYTDAYLAVVDEVDQTIAAAKKAL